MIQGSRYQTAATHKKIAGWSANVKFAAKVGMKTALEVGRILLYKHIWLP